MKKIFGVKSSKKGKCLFTVEVYDRGATQTEVSLKYFFLMSWAEPFFQKEKSAIHNLNAVTKKSQGKKESVTYTEGGTPWHYHKLAPPHRGSQSNIPATPCS